MEFLKQRFLCTGFVSTAVLSLSLALSGCLSFSPTQIATIPLVIIKDVPIPDEAKQPGSDTTLAEDSAFSVWFMGSEGWESDAIAKVMSNPMLTTINSSYFEAYIEGTFIGLLFANYERVRVNGKWVKMVPIKISQPQIMSVTPTNSITSETKSNP